MRIDYVNRLPPETGAARQLRHRSRGRCQTSHQAVIPRTIDTIPNPLGAFQTTSQAVVGNQGQSRRDTGLRTGAGGSSIHARNGGLGCRNLGTCLAGGTRQGIRVSLRDIDAVAEIR